MTPGGDRFNFLPPTAAYDYVPSPSIDAFLSNPDRRLTEEGDRREYGAVVFVEYLDDRFGADFIRQSYLLLDDGDDDRDPIQIVSDLMGHLDSTYSWDPTHYGEMLPDFWSAVYLQSRANAAEPNMRWDDVHVEDWRDALTSAKTAGDAFSLLMERPHRAVPDGLAVPAEGDAHVGGLDIEPGGAVFVDVAPEPGFDGNLVVTVDVPAHATQAEVRVLPYHNDNYPFLCASGSTSEVQAGGPYPSGTYETTIEISEACPDATVVVAHIDPTSDDTITAALEVAFEDTTPSDPYDPGDLDTGFGGHGWVSDPTAETQQILQLEDGTVVAAGPSPDGSTAWVTRYTPEGLAGPAWGNDTVNGHGVTVLTGHEEILDLIEYSTSSENYIGVLARSSNDHVYVSVLDAGGDLVTDFSDNGTAFIPGPGDYDAHTLLLADGGLIVVGNTASGCGFAARFDLDGELDTAFDTDGVVHVPCATHDAVHPALHGSTFGALVESGTPWAISYRRFQGHNDTAHHWDFTMIVATPIDAGTGAIGSEELLYETADTGTGRIAFDSVHHDLTVAVSADTPFTPGGWLVSRVDTAAWTLDTLFSTDGHLSLYPDIGDSIVLDIVYQDDDDSTYLLVEDSSGDRSVVRVSYMGAFDSGYTGDGHATAGDVPFRPASLAAGVNPETSVGYIWAAGSCTASVTACGGCDTACTGPDYGPGAIARYPIA